MLNHETIQYLLTTVETALVDLLSLGVFPGDTAPRNDDGTRNLRKSIQHLELKLLPQAVGLSDAFGLTDWELDRSVHDSIGCKHFKTDDGQCPGRLRRGCV